MIFEPRKSFSLERQKQQSESQVINSQITTLKFRQNSNSKKVRLTSAGKQQQRIKSLQQYSFRFSKSQSIADYSPNENYNSSPTNHMKIVETDPYAILDLESPAN